MRAQQPEISLLEIAEMFNLDKSYVGKIEKQALFKLFLMIEEGKIPDSKLAKVDNDTKKQFGQWLKEKRIETKVSIRELSTFNINIYKIEKGDSYPHNLALRHIEHLLGPIPKHLKLITNQ